MSAPPVPTRLSLGAVPALSRYPYPPSPRIASQPVLGTGPAVQPGMELPLGHPQRPLPCSLPTEEPAPLPRQPGALPAQFAQPPALPLAELAALQERLAPPVLPLASAPPPPQQPQRRQAPWQAGGRASPRAPHMTLLETLAAPQQAQQGRQAQPVQGLAPGPSRDPGAPPGRVIKTLATLPDVQLLYESRPGPHGVPLCHAVPGLTCSLQLVRLPPAQPGAASQLVARASLCDEMRDVCVTFRDGVRPGEQKGAERGGCRRMLGRD